MNDNDTREYEPCQEDHPCYGPSGRRYGFERLGHLRPVRTAEEQVRDDLYEAVRDRPSSGGGA